MKADTVCAVYPLHGACTWATYHALRSAQVASGHAARPSLALLAVHPPGASRSSMFDSRPLRRRRRNYELARCRADDAAVQERPDMTVVYVLLLISIINQYMHHCINEMSLFKF